MNWFPLLLVVHIGLAISLLAPSLALPFLLRDRSDGSPPGAVTGALLTMQGTGSLVIAVGLAVSGAGLVLSLGPGILSQPWLIVALAIYVANLLVAAFVARPGLRRLAGLTDGDAPRWRGRVRGMRYLAYAMAAATGLIGFLMSTKPELW